MTNLHLADLSLVGGGKTLRLKNCLAGVFERLDINGGDIGLYLEGTNESHTFRDLAITGATHAFICGQLNGGPGTVLDLPEMQKCLFERIRVYSVLNNTAFVVTTGFLGNQQVSGLNYFRKILCEGNQKGNLSIDYSFEAVVDQYSDEGAPDTTNAYTSIALGATGGAGNVTLRDCQSTEQPIAGRPTSTA